jgi:predicted dehydrogenase
MVPAAFSACNAMPEELSMSPEVRWGILSTAAIAKSRLIPSITNSRNGVVAAVASRSLERAREFADEMNIPEAYGSYEELLAADDIDAIYLPLPTAMHKEWAIKCAEAGKPTLCEKPIADNADDARAMVDAFASANVAFAEAFMYKYHPLNRKVKELVDAGTVGDIHIIRAVFNCNPPPEGNFRFVKGMGVGSLRDVGSYCVSFIRMITGEEPCGAEAFAVIRPETGGDDRMTGALQFPSGVLGYFACSLTTFYDCSYEIDGSDGRIQVPLGALCAWPDGEFTIKVWTNDGEEDIAVPAADPYQLMAEDFADCLQCGRPPLYSPEDSVRNMQAIDMLRASAGVA